MPTYPWTPARPSGHWVDYPTTAYGTVGSAEFGHWDQAIAELKAGAVSVADAQFGTAGTGGDDSAAFIAAKNSGAPVILVPNTGTAYNVANTAGTTTVASNQSWIGVGNPTINHITGSTYPVFYWPQSPRTLLSNVTVRGITFQGEITPATEDARSGIYFIYCSDIVIEDCTFQDFKSAGVHLSDVARVWINRNKVYRCGTNFGRNPLEIKSTQSGLTSPTSAVATGVAYITNNYVDTSPSLGIAVVQAEAGILSKVVVANNIVTGCQIGIDIEAGQACENIVANNQVYDFTHAGVWILASTHLSGDPMKNNIVANNIVDCYANAAADGMDIGSSNTVISGNYIRASGQPLKVRGDTTTSRRTVNVAVTGNTLVSCNTDAAAQTLGMQLGTLVTGLTVTGNTLRIDSGATTKDGISLNDVTRTTVIGNVIDTPGRDGIRLTSVVDGLVGDNYVVDSNNDSFAQGANAGISVQAGCSSVTVRGNKISDTRGALKMNNGIWMVSGSNIEFAQNTIVGTINGKFRSDGGIPTFGRSAQDAQKSVLTYGATITTTVANGSVFSIVATNGTAFTISNPIFPFASGISIVYDILNSSGGAMGAITWGALFKLDATGFVNPANGKRKTISFYYDGTNWVQIGPTSADI